MLEHLHNINEDVINGERNPLEAYVELKRIEKLLKDVIKGVQPEAITEAEKYGKGEHEEFGAKFQVKSAAGRWNFKNCDLWVAKNQSLKNLEETLKTVHKTGATVIDEETGEVLPRPDYAEGGMTIGVRL